mmetsp:Transcript_19671/g.54189  ORF Transcript_19671/g.54189 Transcript_19671/m.54189 type:complete len:225 (+) Transcript_19671:375-1049(+)
MVIFAAQLKVREQNGDFGAGDQQDQTDQEQDSKDVVVEVHPHTGEHVVEFHKARAKGQDSANRQGERNAHEPGLIRDLTRNAARVDGVFNGFGTVSKVGAQKHQGRGQSKPQDHQNHNHEKGHGVRGLLRQGHDIHNQKDSKGQSGKRQSSGGGCRLPIVALEGLVHARRHVSTDGAHHGKKDQFRHEKMSPTSRRHESKGGKEDCEHGHAQELSAGSAHDRQP